MSQTRCPGAEDGLHLSQVAAVVSPGLPPVPALLYIFVSKSELNYSGLLAPVLIILSVSQETP